MVCLFVLNLQSFSSCFSVVTETSINTHSQQLLYPPFTLGWPCALPVPLTSFSFTAVLMTEPRALCTLGRSSITKLYAQPTSYAFVLLLAYHSLLQPMKSRNRLSEGTGMLSCCKFCAFPYTFYFYPLENRKVENRVGKVNEINVGKGRRKRRKKRRRKKRIHYISSTNPHLKQAVNILLCLSQASLLMIVFRCQPLRQTAACAALCHIPSPNLPNRKKLLLLGRQSHMLSSQSPTSNNYFMKSKHKKCPMIQYIPKVSIPLASQTSRPNHLKLTK